MAPVIQFADGSLASHGGDEFLFVSMSEAMDLDTTLHAIAVTEEIRKAAIPGVIDICPAHVSYMLRIDADEVDPRDVIPVLSEIHDAQTHTSRLQIQSRIIEMPIYYNDPWTTEVLMRFRDRHQDQNMTDLEYTSKINGFETVQELIDAHSSRLHLATFIGFMPGNAECYQLVKKDVQLEAPKYLRPRTDTPARALGFGGAFSTIYPVQGAGGFQLFGRSPAPVYDVNQSLPQFSDNIVLPRSGDIFSYKQIDAAEYDAIRSEVDNGTYLFKMADVTFDLQSFYENPERYSLELKEMLPRD
jgi:urea carboxylase